MNKYTVEEYLPNALMVVSKTSEDKKKLRSKLSALGAMITMSGLLPAVAGFSKEEHVKALDAVENLMKKLKLMDENTKLIDSCKVMKDIDQLDQLEEQVINCIIALKLALDAVSPRK